MNPMRKKLTLVLILAITLSTISATQYVRADVGFSYEIVHPSDADIRYIGSDNAADGLRVLRADSSNSSVSLEFGKWSGNQTKTYTAAFGIVNEEMFPVLIRDVSVVMHDGAADYMQIWLHAHEDMYAADEAVGDSVFMWDRGVDPNDDTWILGAGNQDSSDAGFGLTPWDSDSRVRYGSGTSSVGAVQTVSDFVWVQIFLVVPGGAFAGSIAGSIVFDFSTDILDESDVKKIFTIEDLDAMRYDVSADYVLMNDLDFYDDDSYDNALVNKSKFISGEGWMRVGSWGSEFTGSFNGQGFTISHLYSNRPGVSFQGLFGRVDNATVSNVTMNNVTLVGHMYVGGLVGDANYAVLLNCFTSGSIQATGNFVGGLAGRIIDGVVSQCYSTVSLSSSASLIGGLIGVMDNGVIKNCYAQGSVNGTGHHVGGLLGGNPGVLVLNCYATGSVVTDGSGGGLVGAMWGSGAVQHSFYDMQTSGKSDTGKGSGLSSVEMMSLSTFSSAGWDIVDVGVYSSQIWFIDDGVWYPQLGNT
jgi:hypothetical protein